MDGQLVRCPWVALLLVALSGACDRERPPSGGSGPSLSVAPGAAGGRSRAPELAARHTEAIPKYVFLFIGDGMGAVQIDAAEAYRAQLRVGDAGPGEGQLRPLRMTRLPVRGATTTWASDRLITDSAAAATAMACGIKTKVGAIGQGPDGKDCQTVAEAAKARGMKVGIVSSVSLDHATPAAFYAHSPSRYQYHDISMQLADSAFDYFAGGGLKGSAGPRGSAAAPQDALALAQSKGFELVDSLVAPPVRSPGRRVIASGARLDGDAALPYAIDREPGEPSLAEFTRRGIELLAGPDGFFMMVEGGKIDWACHANDARTAIDEVVDFDAAIGEALSFREQHPQETLIVVTADHETGGMSLGFNTTGYASHLRLLAQQRSSHSLLDGRIRDYLAKHRGVSRVDSGLRLLISEELGLDFEGALTPTRDDDLTAREREAIERALGAQRAGRNPPGKAEQEAARLLYGGNGPLAVTLIRTLQHRAGIGFNTYSHTAVSVPVFAAGVGAGVFDGSLENTSIASSLASAMEVTLASASKPAP